MLREELVNADLNLEKIRQKSAEASLQNQEILANERRRRLEAEEDARLHSEVFLRSLTCTNVFAFNVRFYINKKNIVSGAKISEG